MSRACSQAATSWLMNSLPQSSRRSPCRTGTVRSVVRPGHDRLRRVVTIEQFSVQPITTSVIVNVRANSPIMSAAVRHVSPRSPRRRRLVGAGAMLIELRSSARFVVEMPLIRIRPGRLQVPPRRGTHRLQLANPPSQRFQITPPSSAATTSIPPVLAHAAHQRPHMLQSPSLANPPAAPHRPLPRTSLTSPPPHPLHTHPKSALPHPTHSTSPITPPPTSPPQHHHPTLNWDTPLAPTAPERLLSATCITRVFS